MMDIEEQYDKIYRYCYFKLHHQETAEDITQEAFLRYFEKYPYAADEQSLRCLYTIARNLCIDEYRRYHMESLDGSFKEEFRKELQEDFREEQRLTGIAVKSVLSYLEKEEQELLLLRYVNEVPVSTISKLLGISRFAVYRKLKAASKKFKEKMEREVIS